VKKIGPGQTIAKGTGDGSAMPLGRETDRISNLAYWAYLVLGLGALIPAVIFLLFQHPSMEGLFWTYVGFLVLVIPILGTIAIILSIKRQFLGLEWKLLVLLVSTTIYLLIFFMMITGLIGWLDQTVIISFGAVTSFFAIWHFVFDR
jgi:hypothetical protein